MDSGVDAKNMLLGKEIELKLGYIGVKVRYIIMYVILLIYF